MYSVREFVGILHKEFDFNLTFENSLERYKDFLMGQSDFSNLNFDYILDNFDVEPLVSREEIENLSPKRHFHYVHLFRSINPEFDRQLFFTFDRYLEDYEIPELLKHLPKNTYENSFPFDEMRQVQRGIFEKIQEHMNNPDITDIIVDAPTGVGKSGIAIACMLQNSSGYLVTANKALQNQYVHEFGWLSDLRGKSNYRCRTYQGHTCKSSPCQDSKESRKICKEESGGCDYGTTKKRVLQKSNYAVMNMHTMIAYSVYVKDAITKRDILVIDEAHSLPEVISSSVGLSLPLKKLVPYGIKEIPRFSTPSSYSSWLFGILDVLESEDAEGEIELDEEGEQLVHKLKVIIAQLDSGNIALDFEEDKQTQAIQTLKLYPVKVEEYYNNIREVAPLRIHLSATILGYKTYCSMLGIKEENVAVLRAPSPFPKEIRPIYTGHNVGTINMGSLNYLVPKIVERIEGLMDHYQDYRGIIHGVTYNICNNIYNNLSPKHRARILFPRMASEQAVCLAKHKESKNTLLLSPSMTEGVDLKGDLSRLQIIVKTPYPYLGDPILQKRKEIYSGYYEMLTATVILQAYGRSVRNTDDWCHTFVLDDSFKWFINSNRGLFPNWFLDAIHWK